MQVTRGKLLPALVVAAVVVSCFPLIHGFPNGHDWIYELVRVAEYGRALEAGQYPPFWASNLYGGYGSPIFLFYAPLFMLVASAFAAVFDSIAWGATAALLLFTACAAYCMVRMVRSALDDNDILSHAAARIAAYLYVLNPYLIGDKLLRNANAEFTALCVAPLAFWGLFAVRSMPRRGTVLLAAGVGLTTLAHNLMALVVVTLLVLAALLLYPPRSERSRFLYVCGGIALGLLMSAFFWLPALLLRVQVQLEQMTTGVSDFHHHFPPLETLFAYEFYSIGWWPLVVLTAALIFIRRKPLERHLRVLAYASAGAAIVLVALQLQVSTWVWEHVPMLPLFQFPWRMMGPLALVIAILGALLFFQFARGWGNTKLVTAELAVLALCIANALPQLDKYRPLTADTVQVLPDKLAAATIRDAAAPATVLDEYLVKGASAATAEQFRATQDPILDSDPPVHVRVRINTSGYAVFDFIASEPATLHLARWAFPVWQATVNDKPVPIETGRLQNVDIRVPAGRGEVALTLHPPALRVLGLTISLLGLLLWLALIFVNRNHA